MTKTFYCFSNVRAYMADHQSLQQQLEMHRRLLNELESQIAGAGELYATPDKLVARELCREKINELEALLNKPIHAYLKRTLAEFERYEDTANIVFPALKPGTIKEQKRDVARVQAFLSGFDPKFSPRNPATLKPNEQAQEEELEPFLLNHTRIVLLGDPGAGKSTALRGLFREYAGRWKKDSAGVVPLFAALNRWQESESFLVFLQKEAQELGDMLPNLLEEGRVLLLLDGLNELPGLKRDKETQEIDDPRSIAIAELRQEYPKVLCLLTCRVKEFTGGPGWCDLHVLPLRREQLEAIAYAYFEEETKKAAQLISILYSGKQEKLQTLAEKPFYLRRLLSFFAAQDKIPENPALLLAYSVEQALDEEIAKGLLKTEEREELKERLSLLAFNMTEAYKISTNQEQAAGWFFYLRNKPDFYGRVKEEPKTDGTELKQAKIGFKKGEGCGLLSLQGNEVKFAHQLLQKIFCAIFLKKQRLGKRWVERVIYGFDEIWPLLAGLETQLINTLSLALKDKDKYVRYSAAEALGYIGDAKAIEPLIQILNDKDSDVRSYAAEALGYIGDARAVKSLSLALKDRDENVRQYAAAALRKIGGPAIKPLIQILNDTNKDVRERATVTLGNISNARPMEPLILALKDKDKYVRYSAAEALGYIGDAKAVEPLILVLKDRDENVRQYAAAALGKIGGPAVEPLIQTLKDKVYYGTHYATQALEKIGGPAVEPLIQTLKNTNKDVRERAAEALGEIGDARALPELKRVVREYKIKPLEGWSVSFAAVIAIKRIKARQQQRKS